MKRLTALLLCCLMVGSFALQSAAAPLGDLFSAQAQVEQKQPEQSDSDTAPSTPAIEATMPPAHKNWTFHRAQCPLSTKATH